MSINIKKLAAGVYVAFAIAMLPFVSAGALTTNYEVYLQYENPDIPFQCSEQRDYVVGVFNTSTGHYRIVGIDFEGANVWNGPSTNYQQFTVSAFNAQSVANSIAAGNLRVYWVGSSSGLGDIVSFDASSINNDEQFNEDLSLCVSDPDPEPLPALKPAKTAIY